MKTSRKLVNPSMVLSQLPVRPDVNPENLPVLTYNNQQQPAQTTILEQPSTIQQAPNDIKPSIVESTKIVDNTSTKTVNLKSLKDPENLKISNDVEGTKIVGKKQEGNLKVLKSKNELKKVSREQINNSNLLVCQYGNQSDLEVYGHLRNTLECVKSSDPKIINDEQKIKRTDYRELNELKRKYLYGNQTFPTDNEYIINQQITLSSKSQELIPDPKGMHFKDTWGIGDIK